MSTGQSRDWYLEAALNYSRKFGHHNVSALAMYNQSMKYYYSDKFPGFPVVTLDLWDVPLMTIRLAIWWISVSVTMDPKILLKEKRFGFFPCGVLLVGFCPKKDSCLL